MYREPAQRPKSRLPLLERLTKKTPCKASWNDMHGDDRVRFCCACSKNVYDVAAMSEDEAEGFLAQHFDDQEPCVRLYRRPDGRVLTSDCPRGAHKRHVRRVVLAVVVAACAVVAGSAALADLPVPRTHHRPTSTSRFEVPRATVRPSRPRDLDVDPPRALLDESSAWGEDLALQPFAGLPWDADDVPSPPAYPLAAKAPHVRMGTIVATNGMPTDVIARIVKYGFGRFLRACYEDASSIRPAPVGRIAIGFEIARDGSVWKVRDEDSDIADAKLVACVVRAAEQLVFPRPEEGKATVTLPLFFRPPG